MKVVNLVTRRSDLTRSQFRDYYESRHAPLGSQYFPFEKYVRNHLVESDPQDVGFDCVMECWLDHRKALELLENREICAVFDEDEGKFMAQRAIGVEAEEILLAGTPRDLDAPDMKKQVLLLKRLPELSRSAFDEKVAAWGRDLGKQADLGLIRIVMDKVVSADTSPLHADALLTGWFKSPSGSFRNLAVPAGMKLVATVTTKPHETSAAQLAAAFGSYKKK